MSQLCYRAQISDFCWCSMDHIRSGGWEIWKNSISLILLLLTFSGAIFFSFLAILLHMEFPGQGSNLTWSSNLCHSYCGATGATAWGQESNHHPRYCRDTINTVAPQWEFQHFLVIYIKLGLPKLFLDCWSPPPERIYIEQFSGILSPKKVISLCHFC